MNRRDFIKGTAAALPMVALPFIPESEKALSPDFIDDLTEDEIQFLKDKYEKLICCVCWFIERDCVIKGGLVDPMKHEWTPGPSYERNRKRMLKKLVDAAAWYKQTQTWCKRQNRFDSKNFELFAKDAIWREQREIVNEMGEEGNYDRKYEMKTAFAYLKAKDAIIASDIRFWGEVKLILFINGSIVTRQVEKSHWEKLRNQWAYNSEMKKDG